MLIGSDWAEGRKAREPHSISSTPWTDVVYRVRQGTEELGTETVVQLDQEKDNEKGMHYSRREIKEEGA